MVPTQFWVTLGVGLLTIFFPLAFHCHAVWATKPGPIACNRCDADVPRDAVKCPNCGATVTDRNQPL